MPPKRTRRLCTPASQSKRSDTVAARSGSPSARADSMVASSASDGTNSRTARRNGDWMVRCGFAASRMPPRKVPASPSARARPRTTSAWRSLDGRVVVGVRMAPVRDLGDEVEGAVALGVRGARRARDLGGGVDTEPFEIVVRVLHVDAAVDGGGVDRGVGGLGFAGRQRHAEGGRDLGEDSVQLRGRTVHVVVDAARLAVVQRGQKARPGGVQQPHQRQGLGQYAVEPRLLVGEREGPLDLFVAGGPVEVASVVALVGRGGEPALVEAGPVRVDAGHDVPGPAEVPAQFRVFAQGPGQVQGGHRADRLVGVHPADDDVSAVLVRREARGAFADREAVQGLAQGGGADPALGHQAGVSLRQLPEGGEEFVHGRVGVGLWDGCRVPYPVPGGRHGGGGLLGCGGGHAGADLRGVGGTGCGCRWTRTSTECRTVSRRRISG